MAKFCAHVDVHYGAIKINIKNDYLEKILYEGNRGFISFSEDELAKEFDKRLETIRTLNSKLKDKNEKRKNDLWYRKTDEDLEIELWYEEGIAIANQVFEDQFL